MRKDKTRNEESFRVPNSIIQGMTTRTRAKLNQLTRFEMLILLGLMSRVTAKNPDAEVTVSVADLLDVIDVSKRITLAVKRTWKKDTGESKQRAYKATRHSSNRVRLAHKALLSLFRREVVVQTSDPKTKQVRQTRVHVLDSFGYVYKERGKQLDVHRLPDGFKAENVGSSGRHVYLIIDNRKTPPRKLPVKSFVFRINRELAQELRGTKETIQFTWMVRRVFTLFKRLGKSAVAIRVAVLMLRQTNDELSRKLDGLTRNLNYDPSHFGRAIDSLTEILRTLRDEGVLVSFEIDQSRNRLNAVINREWYKGEPHRDD